MARTPVFLMEKANQILAAQAVKPLVCRSVIALSHYNGTQEKKQ